MSYTIRYAASGLAALAVVTGLLWPFLDGGGRQGVMVAAVVAWPLQVLLFGLMVRWRGELPRFLLAWLGGTVVRMGVVLGGGLLLVTWAGLEPLPTLLAMAGFLFGLLLLEAPFFAAALRATEQPLRTRG